MNFDVLSLLDLTSLNETDTDVEIISLCQQAVTPTQHVAAVCVYPQFVSLARMTLKDAPVRVATVANFPHGESQLAEVMSNVQSALSLGADEIDLVFPYKAYCAGKKSLACEMVSAVRQACGEARVLKVILESGAFTDAAMLAEASRDVLFAGANFLKTSTGKIAVGATLDAAKVMLLALKEMSSQLDRPLGFKASGGIRTVQQAGDYIALAEEIMGAGWVSPKTFRIGTSRLLCF